MVRSEKYLIILIVLTLFKRNVAEGQHLKTFVTEHSVEDDAIRFKRDDDSAVESGEGDSIGRLFKHHVPPGHNKQNKPNQNNGNRNHHGRPGRHFHLHHSHVPNRPCTPKHTYRYYFGPNHFPYHSVPKPLRPSHRNEEPHQNFYYGYGPNSFLKFNVPKPLLKNCDENLFADNNGNKPFKNRCLQNKNHNKPDCEQNVQISNVNGFIYANGVRAFLIDANDIRK